MAKKALLLSDSHGINDNMREVISLNPDVDAVFHMGDILGAVDLLEQSANAIGCMSYVVRGNCDFRASDMRDDNLIEFAGKRIAQCHGHRFGGYGGIDVYSLRYFGEERKADVVLFGHTHRPYLAEIDGMIICNPGSITQPRQADRKYTFAIMTVYDDGKIEIKHYSYDRNKNVDERIELYEKNIDNADDF